RAIVREAVVQSILIRDPFVGLTWKDWDIPPADPFTPEERERVLAWFDGRTFWRKLVPRQHPAFHAFSYFQFWHGVRPSEAAGLDWDNVDLDHGVAASVGPSTAGKCAPPRPHPG